MKEKLTNILNKVKEFFKNIKLPEVDLTKAKSMFAKVKEKLQKNNFLKKLVLIAKKYHLILSLIFFCIAILTLILIAILAQGEFVVQVCILMIIAVTMAVLLHRSELWLHAILLAALLIVGFLIDRAPLTILCVIAYVVTTITLQLAFKKEVDNKEKKETK